MQQASVAGTALSCRLSVPSLKMAFEMRVARCDPGYGNHTATDSVARYPGLSCPVAPICGKP
jgi:hypothetical protein